MLIVNDVAKGLVVYPKTIEAAVAAELPFMATEEILMAGVRAGGDRQDLHKRVRDHSQLAGQRVKAEGVANDLMERLRGDTAFAKVDLSDVMTLVVPFKRETYRQVVEAFTPFAAAGAAGGA